MVKTLLNPSPLSSSPSIPIDGEGRGGVALIFRKMRLLIYRAGCLRVPLSLGEPVWKWQRVLLSVENPSGGVSFVFSLCCSLLTDPRGVCSSLTARLNPKSIAAAPIVISRKALSLSPTLRSRGEGIRGAGLFYAFEGVERLGRSKWNKGHLESVASYPLSANFIGGEGRGEVVLSFRNGGVPPSPRGATYS